MKLLNILVFQRKRDKKRLKTIKITPALTYTEIKKYGYLGMQYEIDLFEFSSELNPDYIQGDGNTFLSEDHLHIKPFVGQLPEHLGGFLVVLKWTFMMKDQYTGSQVYSAEGSQDIYILPGENNVEQLVQLVRASESEFLLQIAESLKNTHYYSLKEMPIDAEGVAKTILSYIQDPF